MAQCSTSCSVRWLISVRRTGSLTQLHTGIGLSGSYMVVKNDYQPLKVHMGRTLLVSGAGLLLILISTLILVPANGFWMNKKLGAGLIMAYTVRCCRNPRLCSQRMLTGALALFDAGTTRYERLCRDLVVVVPNANVFYPGSEITGTLFFALSNRITRGRLDQ